MKKKLVVPVALLLVICMGGCSLTEIIGTKTITCDDLTAQVPGLYFDLMSGVDNDDVAFLYGNDSGAVMGIQESIAEVAGSYADSFSAKEYLRNFMSANELLGTITETEDLVYFIYSQVVEGTKFTYICAAFKGSEHFWAVQAYCKDADFAKNQDTLMEIIRSVQVK